MQSRPLMPGSGVVRFGTHLYRTVGDGILFVGRLA
jgi:hypothetical protein